MSEGVKLTVYPVKDIEKAKAVYSTLLGVAPYIDSAYYVGFRVADQEFGLDPNGFSAGLTGPINYFPVSDIKATLKSLLDAGAQVQQDVKNVGGSRLIAWVKDADGNTFGLMQD